MEQSSPFKKDISTDYVKNDLVKGFIPVDPEIKAMEVSQSGSYVFLGVFNTNAR
jgi:hypothetical protein